MTDTPWRQVEMMPRELPGLPPIHVVRCGIARWPAAKQASQTARSNWQFALVTAGSASYRLDTRQFDVPCGSLFIQSAGARCHHRCGKEGLLHKRWCELDGPGLPAWLHSLGLSDRPVIRPDDPAAVAAVLRTLQATAHRRPPGYLTQLSLLACELLLLLDQGQRMPAELETLLACLDDGRPWTVPELAERCGCHQRRLQRLCRQHLHRSPQELLRERRLERACDLLEDSGLDMATIADELGFADQFTFTHFITRNLGCSPSAWRHRHQG